MSVFGYWYVQLCPTYRLCRQLSPTFRTRAHRCSMHGLICHEVCIYDCTFLHVCFAVQYKRKSQQQEGSSTSDCCKRQHAGTLAEWKQPRPPRPTWWRAHFSPYCAPRPARGLRSMCMHSPKQGTWSDPQAVQGGWRAALRCACQLQLAQGHTVPRNAFV